MFLINQVNLGPCSAGIFNAWEYSIAASRSCPHSDKTWQINKGVQGHPKALWSSEIHSVIQVGFLLQAVFALYQRKPIPNSNAGVHTPSFGAEVVSAGALCWCCCHPLLVLKPPAVPPSLIITPAWRNLPQMGPADDRLLFPNMKARVFKPLHICVCSLRWQALILPFSICPQPTRLCHSLSLIKAI